MDDIETEKKVVFSDIILKNINKTRKWTLFLSLLGSILAGVYVIFGIVTGTIISLFSASDSGPGLSEFLMISVLAILALAGFIPVIFLFRFSKFAGEAVKTGTLSDFEKAFKNLKRFFAYLGYLALAAIILYLASFIFSGTISNIIDSL